MAAIQLEFNVDVDKDEKDIRLMQMQQSIDALHESLDKVRRKLFAELQEVKKTCVSLEEKHNTLFEELAKKKKWVYAQSECLFSLT